MSNPNETESKELAERMWDQQGKREDHATGDWLENEYRAHPPIAPVQNEADLRMRGLGPMATNDEVIPSPYTSEPAVAPITPGKLLVAAGVCVGIGLLWSVFRKISI